MAKIKLKKLPDGFEIKDGKVVKKMQQGGMMTGDQSNYSLVTTPYNLIGDQFNNEKDNDIRYSLSSVPREIANIEAEGGETVLTDLNNDGQFGLYNITGPRHGSGGVPMFLPEQSFVFSDTQKMKMNREELAEFGIESRKKMTPAKVSKRYQLNEFIGAMQDIDADPIKVKSANLMIDKNSKALSKLAFGQEAKKQFSEGVPLASYPYLISQGIDPIEFTQQVENINREQATMRAMQALSPQQQAQIMALRDMMEQAGQIQPQAAYGKELQKAQEGVEKEPEKKYIAYDPKLTENYKKLGIDVDTSGILAKKYADKQGYVSNTGFYGGAEENYEGFINSWKDIYPDIDKLKNAIDNQTTDLKGGNPEVKKFQEWLNNTYIPQEVEKISKNIIDSGQKWTDKMSSELIEKIQSDYGFGKGKGKDFDGDFGTFSSSRRPLTFNPKKPVEKPVEKMVEPGQTPEAISPEDPEFWLQDEIQMAALAMRDRDMFLPWQPQVEVPRAGYVLEDPTRQIAAINEQSNIAAQALGAFAGPQSLSARLSKSQANALPAIADTLAQVNARNVGTVNRGKVVDAQLRAAAEKEQRGRSVKEFDDTQLTLQNYMDEKNLDREQMADLTANAYTNMANTYNLNTLYPYYNIDPQSGGMINITADLPTLVANQQAGTQLSPFDEMSQKALNLKARGLDGTTINTILQNAYGGKPVSNAQGVDPNADVLRMIRESGMPAGYPATTGKKGKEIKKYATPFYTGKIGF